MSQWSEYHHMTAWTIFLDYKIRVPVRGAILLNHDMDEVVLVKGWKKGANWSFPRGKINKNEKDLDCAVREVYEETGFDVREANLIPDDDQVKSIEISMREQHMQLFVFRDVPRDAHFEPRTRKEISKIEWYKLSDLPTLKKNRQDDGLAVVNANKFYMVAPFLGPLKKWIVQQKKIDQKAQAAVESEGYPLVEDNGTQSKQAAVSALPQAVPSDLPEVTSTTQDASSHLKRLLNIGGPAQVPTATQPGEQPIKTAMVDRSKSNALLALLQQGSQDTASRVSNVVSASPSQQNAPAMAQAPHLAPNFFPGFPQQQTHLHPSNFGQQTSAQFFPSQNGHTLSPHHSTNQLELSASPSVQQVSSTQVPGYQSQQHISQMLRRVPLGQAQAPFQQTGDPQFSQQSQPAQSMGAAVPHASKLPPPKLTNHSRALLGFFKANASPSPSNTQPASLAVQGSGQPRKASHHQDSLLSLFKSQAAEPAPQPVELSGNPVPPSLVAPTGVQILQRTVQQAAHKPTTPSATKPNPSSATVSGPLNMPQFEATSKSSPKRGSHGSGSSRKGRFDQSAHRLIHQMSSPVTILPRPQSVKLDPSPAGPSAQSTHSHVVPTQAPEPVKPFQPQQILRRSEKTGYENLMGAPRSQQAVAPEPTVQPQAAELAPQTTFDRRPSQNDAQKDALLSLFGTQGLSSPPSVPQHESHATATNQSAAAVSGLVSPLSSRQFPSSGESLSRHGTPSETEMVPNRIASPHDKAFLLGYLQNVAKGSQ